MSLLFDKCIRWSDPEVGGDDSLCRVRIFNLPEISPVVFLMNSRNNKGAGVARGLNALMSDLLPLAVEMAPEDVLGFDSFMWFLAKPTACGWYLFRVREAEKGYQVESLYPMNVTAFEGTSVWSGLQELIRMEGPHVL